MKERGMDGWKEGRKKGKQRERKAQRKQEKENGRKEGRKNKLLSFGFDLGFDGDGFIEGGVNDNSTNAIWALSRRFVQLIRFENCKSMNWSLYSLFLYRIITRWLL
jgi:hypothetical protein